MTRIAENIFANTVLYRKHELSCLSCNNVSVYVQNVLQYELSMFFQFHHAFQTVVFVYAQWQVRPHALQGSDPIRLGLK